MAHEGWSPTHSGTHSSFESRFRICFIARREGASCSFLCVCLFVCTYRACPPVLLVFDLLTYLCVRVCIRVCVYVFILQRIYLYFYVRMYIYNIFLFFFLICIYNIIYIYIYILSVSFVSSAFCFLFSSLSSLYIRSFTIKLQS